MRHYLLFTSLLWLVSPISLSDTLPRKVPVSTYQASQSTKTSAPSNLKAKAYLLIDATSGTILAEQDSQKQIEPASLTKMLVTYIVSEQIKNGQVSLDDKVHISSKAWQTPGSRMFVREGQRITLENLVQGVVVQSGNDASVALAEHIAGSVERFTQIMNDTAKRLGMNHSHFTDPIGMPNPKQYTTAFDLAILARALIHDHPEHYRWYKQKWFSFNKIKQPNRNRLLWRLPYVDGIKTGHTSSAGYCMVSSGEKNNMRLIGVTLGSPSDEARARDGKALITYGFQSFESHKLYDAKQTISTPRIWGGQQNAVRAGLEKPINVVIAKGHYSELSASMRLTEQLQAPIKQGQTIGSITITLDGKILDTQPLIALNSIERAHMVKRWLDHLRLSWHNWTDSRSQG